MYSSIAGFVMLLSNAAAILLLFSAPFYSAPEHDGYFDATSDGNLDIYFLT